MVSEPSQASPVKEDIETIIDRLHKFVEANKKTSLKNAARALALPATQVEKLALLLEEGGLVRVHYGLLGTKLVSKELSEEEAARRKAVVKKRRDLVLEESKEAEREVMTAENLLEFIERDVSRRLQNAEKLFKDLEKRDQFSPKDIEFLRHELNFVLQQAAMFEDEVRKLKTRESELTKIVLDFKQRLDTLEKQQAAFVEKPSLFKQFLAALRELIQRIKTFFAAVFAAITSRAPAAPSKPVAVGPAAKPVAEKEKEKEKEKIELKAVAATPTPPAKKGITISIPSILIRLTKPKKPKPEEVKQALVVPPTPTAAVKEKTLKAMPRRARTRRKTKEAEVRPVEHVKHLQPAFKKKVIPLRTAYKIGWRGKTLSHKKIHALAKAIRAHRKKK